MRGSCRVQLYALCIALAGMRDAVSIVNTRTRHSLLEAQRAHAAATHQQGRRAVQLARGSPNPCAGLPCRHVPAHNSAHQCAVCRHVVAGQCRIPLPLRFLHSNAQGVAAFEHPGWGCSIYSALPSRCVLLPACLRAHFTGGHVACRSTPLLVSLVCCPRPTRLPLRC